MCTCAVRVGGLGCSGGGNKPSSSVVSGGLHGFGLIYRGRSKCSCDGSNYGCRDEMGTDSEGWRKVLEVVRFVGVGEDRRASPEAKNQPAMATCCGFSQVVSFFGFPGFGRSSDISPLEPEQKF